MRRVFALMVPVTLGLGLINLNVLVDTCSPRASTADIGPAAVDKAFRIYMLPQGIFSVAVAAVLFPTLSRYAAARNGPGFRDLLGAGLRQIAFLLVPAAAPARCSPTPMVRLLYQHGNFTPRDTIVVASCLAGFSAGLAFNGAMLLLIRAFFSLQLTWLRPGSRSANLVPNAVLDGVFTARSLGVWGIPLATSIVNVLGVALLYLRLGAAGRLDEREIVRSLVRVAVACASRRGRVLHLERARRALGSRRSQLVSLGAGLARPRRLPLPARSCASRSSTTCAR